MTKKPPNTVPEAAASGNRLELLLALRRRLAEALDDPRTHPRDLSPLTLRLSELATEIEKVRDLEREHTRLRLVASTEDEVFDPDAI